MPRPRRLEDLCFRAFSKVVELERGEAAVLAWAVLGYMLLLTGYYIARPVRETFGLASGIDRLPEMMLATVLASLVLNPLYAGVVARLPRSRLVPRVYRGVSLCFVAFFLALQVCEGDALVWVGRAFYVFLSVVNLFLVSVYFSLLADLFDRKRATRLYGMVAAGGSLGGMLGGTLTSLLVDELGHGGLLLVSCVFFEGALRAARGVMRSLERRAASADAGPAALPAAPAPRADLAIGGSRWAAFSAVARSPYLLGIGAYVLIYGVSGTLAYFFQAAVVNEAGGGATAASTKIFANLDVYTNLVALFLQVAVAGRLLKRIGAGATLVILPLYSVLGFVLLASGLVPAGSLLLVFGAFQVLRRGIGYGLKKPAQELLFTVLSPEDKYKAKNLVDLVGPRTGDVLGAGTTKLLTLAGYGVVGLAATAAPVCLVWIAAALALGRGFGRRAAADHGSNVSS